MKLLIVLSGFIAICSGFGWQDVMQSDEEDFKKFMHILSKPRMPERYKQHHKNTVVKTPLLKSFNWKSCNTTEVPFQLESLQLSPDPVKLPGNVTVDVKGTLTQSVKAPVQLKLKIKKKVVFWIEVPCIDNIGSCDYDDMCKLLETIQCPDKIPCHCPFPSGSFVLPKSNFFIDPGSEVPSWLEAGDYQITADLSQSGKPLGCLQMELSLSN